MRIAYFYLILILSVSCKNPVDSSLKQLVLKQTDIPAIEVEICPAITKKLQAEIKSTGKVEAGKIFDLQFQREGYLTYFPFREGETIKRGILMGSIDTTNLTWAVRQAEDQLKIAAYEKFDLCYEMGYDSCRNLPPYLDQALDIRSGYLEAKTNFEKAKSEIQQANIYAPFDGVLFNIKKSSFQYVQPGEVIASFYHPRELIVRVGMLEHEVAQIVPGMQAKILLQSLPEKKIQGSVVSINPFITTEGLSYIDIRFITDPGYKVFPGMYSEVWVIVEGKATYPIIPMNALLTKSGRAMVFVWDSVKNIAEWRYVTPGSRNTQEVEIVEGLAAGEMVICKNHQNLSHETKVKPLRLSLLP